MHPGQYYRYLQFRHAWQAEGLPDQDLPEFAHLEGHLVLGPLRRKAVSLTYKALNNNTPDSLANLRVKWEIDVGILEEIDWSMALMHPR